MTRFLQLAVALFACAAPAADELDADFDRDVLIIEASDFACYRFDVYLAIDREQTRRGLMFVRSMPVMTGMLFVYDHDDHHAMWMKNTLIPLDMVFARSDGTISSVIRDTEPQSLRSLSAIEPVRYVLELNAGVTERYAIDVGGRLLWEPMLANDE